MPMHSQDSLSEDTTMIQPLVIANWKMNGSAQINGRLLDQLLPGLSELHGVRIALCPPFPYLSQVGQSMAANPVRLGAQNVNAETSGAFTGEVSPLMLRELGCQYVLLGHSERRNLFGETDAEVAAKFAATLEAGLTPVLCVGETLAQRRDQITEQVVETQIEAVLERVGIQGFKRAVIAYEPVWAIGTGETASPEQAQQVHGYIRQLLCGYNAAIGSSVQLLYGGSVKADNAEALFKESDINGGLIGGASLDAVAFIQICQAAAL